MNTLSNFTDNVNPDYVTAIQVIKLDAETYAKIDPAYNLVTLHRGQNTQCESDWGGQVIGSLALDHALAIVKAAYPQALFERIEARVLAEVRKTLQGAPADFTEAVIDVGLNGIRYCDPDVDWGSVEDEVVFD